MVAQAGPDLATRCASLPASSAYQANGIYSTGRSPGIPWIDKLFDSGRMNNDLPKPKVQLQPRLIRLRNAPFYLGMDRNRFNAEVHPFMTELRIGVQGIAFDRVDLDL